MILEKLRDEIVESQKARTDLIKWKLVLVAAIGAAGLGSTVIVANPVLLVLVPFVCLYVDAVCFHNDLRIFAIAQFLRSSSDKETVRYEQYCHLQRPYYTFEAIALQWATQALSFVILVIGWATYNWPKSEFISWVRNGNRGIAVLLIIAGGVGCLSSSFFFHLYRHMTERLDGNRGWTLVHKLKSLLPALRKEELIDVVRSDGTLAGIQKTEAKVHREGLWHRAAHVWIINSQGGMLLQRRSRNKEKYPGLWDVSAAGHVMAGENAAECAVRETYEELGLRIHADELRHIGTLRKSHRLEGGTYIDNELHEVFVVQRDIDLTSLTFHDGEVEDVKFVSELPSDELVPHAEEEYVLLAKVRAAQTTSPGS